MTSLATRIEAAGPEDQRELLDDAWQAMKGSTYTTDTRQVDELRRFIQMLDAGAYLSAAEMLVPKGWIVSLDQWPTRTVAEGIALPDRYYRKDEWRATLTEDGGGFRQVSTVCHTPALALLAAIIRALDAHPTQPT